MLYYMEYPFKIGPLDIVIRIIYFYILYCLYFILLR